MPAILLRFELPNIAVLDFFLMPHINHTGRPGTSVGIGNRDTPSDTHA